MTFEEMLDHALAMLQRRGRLTCRAPPAAVYLDDDALNDLKDALLYAHPEVHDEGRGLVWTGESSRASPAGARRSRAVLWRRRGTGAGAGAAAGDPRPDMM